MNDDLVVLQTQPPAGIIRVNRERKLNAAPSPVWEPDWQDCPVALRMRGLARRVISVEIPLVFPPADMPISMSSGQHWFIVHREDAAKVLLLLQQVQSRTQRYLETAYSRTRLQGNYDWDALVLDANVRRMARNDFEIFFERDEWFRQHNLPYRRGYLLWGAPGNGKSGTIRVMAAHPYIQPYTLDLSDAEEKIAALQKQATGSSETEKENAALRAKLEKAMEQIGPDIEKTVKEKLSPGIYVMP